MRTVILGAGGHGRVIAEMIAAAGMLRLIGFIDSNRIVGEIVLSHPILGCEDDLPSLVLTHDLQAIVIGIGDNSVRSTCYEKIRGLAPSLEFPAVIHPSAIVSPSATLGQGSVVMPGAVINTQTSIGEFCIVNTRSSIDHDGCLGDFASIAPGVSLGGNVYVGDYAAIGIGATVIHKVRIESDTVVGAGSTVINDLPPLTVAYGTPARPVRIRTRQEPYL